MLFLAVLPHNQDTLEKWDLQLGSLIRLEAIACSTRMLPKSFVLRPLFARNSACGC
jgi:hypothetical protein